MAAYRKSGSVPVFTYSYDGHPLSLDGVNTAVIPFMSGDSEVDTTTALP